MMQPRQTTQANKRGPGRPPGTGGRAKSLTTEDVKHVLSVIGHNSRMPERDRALVLLSVHAGLRAGEIAQLRWRDALTAGMDAVADYIDLPRLATKGRHTARTIPVSDELRAALEALMAAFPQMVAPDLVVVFSDFGRKYAAQSVVKKLKALYDSAGLSGVSSHSGRRTFATNMARALPQHGGTLSDLQSLLGHSSVATTRLYVDESTKAKARALATATAM